MVQHELPADARARTGVPVRTCVGCRKRELATDLLRVVVAGSGPEGSLVTPDLRRRLPGRGAWIHPDPECLSLAERRRAFGRALRVSGPLDISAVGLRVAAEAERSAPARDVESSTEPLEEKRHTQS
ncbi:YlxR family protein [Rhodococcus triatomae]|uniref:YlxR family protein n=1 Tax=Rhodococcus triatomae TaxID=300028 RepID=UPI0009348721|nr:YlxR family protein [Rhodococcus triatomae]QNG19163.1 YlxR family protein [Rhodococcus triatomae]QNG24925.1 YlxR family protein [Rhodococcus triatomae]